MSAVRQAAIMTDEESKRVAFKFAKKKLTLQAQGQSTGRSKVELPIEYDGKEIKISFDAQYVIDMLKVLPPDAPLTLELVDAQQSGAVPQWDRLFVRGDAVDVIV